MKKTDLLPFYPVLLLNLLPEDGDKDGVHELGFEERISQGKRKISFLFPEQMLETRS